MHLHFIGICGTFMGNLAILAKQLGHQVSGCDANVYPPMSDQLQRVGIDLIEGFDTEQLKPAPDLCVIGNAMSRGNPLVEEVLNNGLAYTSGPEFLQRFILPGKWVIAASGTHGKTTTSTMIASILEFAGMDPGYLIGGVPLGFTESARLGGTPFFVVEADEYDSAFFDKRSKFVHYRPRTLIINNLEFDHADIFSSLADIQRQFHHLVRTVPKDGRIIVPNNTPSIDAVLEQGCWSELTTMGADGEWEARLRVADGTAFDVFYKGKQVAEVDWGMTGQHSVANGLAAIVAAHHVGVLPAVSGEALSRFAGVKRRMEKLVNTDHITLYDDFAHHPTAIETTLSGLRKQVGEEPILAIIEPRSNTMKSGVHNAILAASASAADKVMWFDANAASKLSASISLPNQLVFEQFDELWKTALDSLAGYRHIVIMSNGGFEGIAQRLTHYLTAERDRV